MARKTSRAQAARALRTAGSLDAAIELIDSEAREDAAPVSPGARRERRLAGDVAESQACRTERRLLHSKLSSATVCEYFVAKDYLPNEVLRLPECVLLPSPKIPYA